MKIVIGIDEVGRGPIAGPVTVCALQLKVESLKLKVVQIPLRDSKKLSRVQRELWFAQIKMWQREGKCDFCVSSVSAQTIDRIGIVPAINRALTRSLGVLHIRHGVYEVQILLDGGLRAPKEFKKQKTIIKGDEKEPAIALASIVAKVTRDRHMTRMAKRFPEYGFDSHVGYGTRAHYSAIKQHGLSPLHRKTFLGL